MRLPCLIFLTFLLIGSCDQAESPYQVDSHWDISILPSSVRLDPSTNEIIEHRFDAVDSFKPTGDNLLQRNWIFDGEKAILHAARGEYISFQLVLTNNSSQTLKGIQVDMRKFQNSEVTLDIEPELFLEWAVEVKSPSTGYPKASLGKGWYPDALIPYQYIQADSAEVNWRWVYPLELPDFNNRIDHQKSLVIWVDQYVPYNRSGAPPGDYTGSISVRIGTETKSIPIDLQIWDFSIPNENTFRASLQHEGFLSGMDEQQELAIYQLFKRNRISLMDPTYKPDLIITEKGETNFSWETFDRRMSKYFTGRAFTVEMGYAFGPGYGEPIETFILPFNVYGKHGRHGWPDIGTLETERDPGPTKYYTDAITSLRDHLEPMVNPEKTELTIYLNGLDESYFPEAWDRMVYYGNLFEKFYPETHFRIDGGYSEEAMKVVQHSIDSWASHTINYNYDLIKKYQVMGIEDWLYGPMLYESKVNSWVGSSTFLDLPLINDRAISWSSWKYRTYSWISWGIGAGWQRAWYDPETWKDTYKSGSDSDDSFTFKKLNGNGMLIYSPGIIPNVDVACPSIRLKAMRDGVQEYEYMRLLSQKDGDNHQVDQIVNSIIKQPFGDSSIGNLDVWSFNAEQWDNARIELARKIGNRQ